MTISPMIGVVRFGMKGKLSPRYVGPYEILQRHGKVAYYLKLPSKVASVYPLFMYPSLKGVFETPSPFFLLKDYVWMRTFPMKSFRSKYLIIILRS